MPYLFEPIGFVRSPFVERAAAPRQAVGARGVEARIELVQGRGYEQALEGLSDWALVWVLFVFHRNVAEGRGWKPKVLPPRSRVKRGLFATRSPHRPNPIGLSAVEVSRVEGCVVHVRGVDLLDGTPVLDLKPYVAYADAHPGAAAGWLESPDPIAPWDVSFSANAIARLAWLAARKVELEGVIHEVLTVGPEPNAYRRIRRHGAGFRLAVKEWRVDFSVDARRVVVETVVSGYRPRDLATNPTLELHRAFVASWGC